MKRSRRNMVLPKRRPRLSVEIESLYKNNNMVDADEIVDHLRSNFHEYKRQKLQPFTQCVHRRLSRIVSAAKSESKDSVTYSRNDDDGHDACTSPRAKKRLKVNDERRQCKNSSTSTYCSDVEEDHATSTRLSDEKEKNNIQSEVPNEANVINRGPRFRDLGGMNQVVKMLRRKVILSFCRPELEPWIGLQPRTGILLSGPPGCGKTTLAYAIASEAGVPFYSIKSTQLVAGVVGASEKNIRELFSKAYRTAPSIVFIDEIDAIASKRENLDREMERRIVTQLMACMDEQSDRMVPQHEDASSKDDTCRPGHVLVIGATNRPDALDAALRRPGRFDLEIVVGVPDETARVQILSKLTNNLRTKGDFDLLKLARSTPGFVGADLVALVKEAGSLAMDRIIDQREAELSIEHLNEEYTQVWLKNPWSPEEMEKLYITMGDFEEATKMVQPSSKREGFSSIPVVKWEDVGGLNSLRKKFEEYIIWPIKDPEAYKLFGLNSGNGFLLYGPPGCGKTLIAMAVAGEAGANFIHIKGPELLSKYVGESELSVRKLFSRARKCSPCIIFFDEVDSLATERGKEGGSVVERLLDQLLTELDGGEQRHGVYVIGATNRPQAIDPAVLRPGRLGELLYVPLPSPDERGLILQALAKKKPIDTNIDFVAFGKNDSCNGLSGADLSALMDKAARLALQDEPRGLWHSDGTKKTIKAEHLELALEKVPPSVSVEQDKFYRLWAQQQDRKVCRGQLGRKMTNKKSQES